MTARKPFLDALVSLLTPSDVLVSCRVGDAPTEVELLTADLSPEYVELNAGGMS